MVITTIRRRIIESLRHGPLDHHQIAAELGEAPWLIRSTLKAMRADKLVASEFRRRDVAWRLTDRGYGLVWADAQMEMLS